MAIHYLLLIPTETGYALIIDHGLPINGPFPLRISVPRIVQDGSSDYKAEISFILSIQNGKDVV